MTPLWVDNNIHCHPGSRTHNDTNTIQSTHKNQGSEVACRVHGVVCRGERWPVAVHHGDEGHRPRPPKHRVRYT